MMSRLVRRTSAFRGTVCKLCKSWPGKEFRALVLLTAGLAFVRRILCVQQRKGTGGKFTMRFVFAGLALATLVIAADQSSTPTFSEDVLPILQKNCQTCHRPGQMA